MAKYLILSFSFLFVFLVSTCDNSNPSSNTSVLSEASLIGSWEYSEDDGDELTTWTQTFNNDDSFSVHIVTKQNDTVVEDITNTGTWNLSSDTLTLDFTVEVYSYKASLSGNKLTLVDLFDNTVEVYTKL